MAKASPKNSKKSKKKAEQDKEPRKVAPNVPDGLITIAMSQEDLATFANLLTICSKTFEAMALDAASANDDVRYGVLQARCRLSAMFAEKLVEAYKMPEPVSRDFH